VIHLHSSLRSRTPDDTYEIALKYALRFNISRVTDSTRLDRIGVPVYSAIRPGAVRGSLIVTAGKGITPSEARVGAIMESIELAFSEQANSVLKDNRVLARNMLDHPDHDYDLLDLCPKLGVEIPTDQPIMAVLANDLLTGHDVYVPAELIFIPSLPDEPVYFGYHTNGLASGNTREEATIHGVLEVIERDILSFDFVRDSSVLIKSDNLPQDISILKQQVEASGLSLILRTVLNPFGIPFFKAFLVDSEGHNPVFLNAGYGCHPNSVIAAVRAVTEAIQSRMSFIHGGREDLSESTEAYEDLNFKERSRLFRQSVEKGLDSIGEIAFDQVESPIFNTTEIPEFLTLLLDHLRRSNIVKSVFCAYHTALDEPLQVVKVIIPGLEFYNNDSNRIGHRLGSFAKSAADDHLRRS